MRRRKVGVCVQRLKTGRVMVPLDAAAVAPLLSLFSACRGGDDCTGKHGMLPADD